MCLDRVYDQLTVVDSNLAEIVVNLFSAISRETGKLGQNTANAITNEKNDKNNNNNNIDTNNLLLDIEELKLENE